jgi:AcrR family transcriptional regulator
MKAIVTKNRILAAAASLIAKGGLACVTINCIAKKAGITPAVVYTHFPKPKNRTTLDTIFNEICDDLLNRVGDRVADALGSVRMASPIDQLVSVFEATLDVFRTDDEQGLGYGKAVLRERIIETCPEGRRKIAAMSETFRVVDQLIKDAREMGHLDNRFSHWADGEIRQCLFNVAWSFLRSRYLDEGCPQGQGRLGEQKIETLVLRFLQLFFAEAVRPRIDAYLTTHNHGGE